MFETEAANCNFSQPTSESMAPSSSGKEHYDSPGTSQLTASLSAGSNIDGDIEPEAAISSAPRKMSSDLCILSEEAPEGNLCSGDSEADTTEEEEEEEDDDSDENSITRMDLESDYASEVYHYWRASELDNRPSIDFVNMIERVRKETEGEPITRTLVVNWLVEIVEYHKLIPDTLYLTVSYMDRILSSKPANWEFTLTIAIGSLMIASKYEEIRHPSKIEDLAYTLADQLGDTKAVYKLESAVLKALQFDITIPTTASFLRLFVHVLTAEEEEADDEVPLWQLELQCMASYVAELSLLDYTMNCHAPSMIAASSIFLAKFILHPSNRPWTLALENYTLYKPSDLYDCVQALHHLCCDNNHDPYVTTIRKKYRRRKYKSVAIKHCPPTIPPDFFHSISS